MLSKMADLTDDIWIGIFSYLSFQDLGRTACVSWRWNYLSEDDKLWKKLYRKHYDRKHQAVVALANWREIFSLQVRRKRLLTNVDKMSLMGDRIFRSKSNLLAKEDKLCKQNNQNRKRLSAIERDIEALEWAMKEHSMTNTQAEEFSSFISLLDKWVQRNQNGVEGLLSSLKNWKDELARTRGIQTLWNNIVSSLHAHDLHATQREKVDVQSLEENINDEEFSVVNEVLASVSLLCDSMFKISREHSGKSHAAQMTQQQDSTTRDSKFDALKHRRANLYHYLNLASLTTKFLESCDPEEAARQMEYREQAFSELREEIDVQSQIKDEITKHLEILKTKTLELSDTLNDRADYLSQLQAEAARIDETSDRSVSEVTRKSQLLCNASSTTVDLYKDAVLLLHECSSEQKKLSLENYRVVLEMKHLTESQGVDNKPPTDRLTLEEFSSVFSARTQAQMCFVECQSWCHLCTALKASIDVDLRTMHNFLVCSQKNSPFKTE